jgi:hypothetical protein
MAVDLEELRQRKRFAELEWKWNFDQGDIDQRYINGDPFTPQDKRAWNDMYGHDPIAVDQLGSHVNRISNQVLSKPRGPKVSQASATGSALSAAARGDIMCGIDYMGNAQAATLLAYTSMIETGIGVYGLTKEYRPGSRQQDIKYRSFANRKQVLFDPSIVEVDGSDANYAFVEYLQPRKEFEREFTGARSAHIGFDLAEATNALNWFQTQEGIEYVVKCEYWNIEKAKEKLLFVKTPGLVGPDGRPIHGHDLDVPASQIKSQGMEIVNKQLWAPMANGPGMGLVGDITGDRFEIIPKVTQYITNGYEILETTPWDTRQIPLILMLGKQRFVERGGQTRREILSLIRLARQAYLALCYVRSKQLLLAGMAPVSAPRAVVGQLTLEQKENWGNSHRKFVDVLEYSATLEHLRNPDGSYIVLPPPSRDSFDPGAIQSLEMMAQSLIRDVGTAMGMAMINTALFHDKSKSGKALEEMQDVVDQGGSHFVDTYEKSRLRGYKIVNDQLDYLVSKENPRDFLAITPDKKEHVLTIGREAIDPRNKETRTIDLGYSEDHSVTISVGKAADSLKDDADGFLEQIMENGALAAAIQSNPAIAPELVGAAIRSRDGGPAMDAIADVIDPQDEESGKGKLAKVSQIAAQQAEQLKQAEVVVQKLQADVTRLSAGVDKQALANEGAKERVMLQEQTKLLLAEFAANQSSSMAMITKRLDEISAELAHNRQLDLASHQARLQPEPVAQ